MVAEVDAVVFKTLQIPAILVSPATPKPPETIKAPVLAEVDAVVLKNLQIPAALTFPAIPRPPEITTAPVLDDVDAVVSVIVKGQLNFL